MKNVFDTVMDYIDENIHETTEAIKIGIHRATGYNSKDFGGYFQMILSISYPISEEAIGSCDSCSVCR